VRNALGSNNYLAALGTTKGQMVSVDLTAGTSLHSVDEFKKLIVKQKDGAIVRLEDIATVSLGAENYDFTTAFGGRNAGVHRHQSGARRQRTGRREARPRGVP
jgi:multidrug efflux pump